MPKCSLPIAVVKGGAILGHRGVVAQRFRPEVGYAKPSKHESERAQERTQRNRSASEGFHCRIDQRHCHRARRDHDRPPSVGSLAICLPKLSVSLTVGRVPHRDLDRFSRRFLDHDDNAF